MYSQHKITLNIEIDEAIYDGIAEFINSHKDWDRERIINTSLYLFLLHNSIYANNKTYKDSSKTYLNSGFPYSD